MKDKLFNDAASPQEVYDVNRRGEEAHEVLSTEVIIVGWSCYIRVQSPDVVFTFLGC
jgi:hypothetical protein